MNFKFQVTGDSLTPFIGKLIRDLDGDGKRRIQGAMAGRFNEIVLGSFGDMIGSNRQAEWPALSKRYARRVGRSEATLFLSSDLFNSIKLDAVSDPAVVYTDNPYAEAHQQGDSSKNLPRRPFFPLDESFTHLTPYAEKEVLDAAEAELIRILDSQ